MVQALDRVNRPQGIDHFHAIVAQSGHEQIAASWVVAEVIDAPENAWENYAGPRSERR